MVKAAGRLRNVRWLPLIINPLYFILKPQIKVGIIGAGQFSFSTISFFLVANRLGRISSVFDINADNAKTLSLAYNAKQCDTPDEVIQAVDVVYVASNHNSHTSYALSALQQEKKVYCEKPIAATFDQLRELYKVVSKKDDLFFCGYNRPHSSIIRHCKTKYASIFNEQPITMSCYVRGHDIPSDHWYRNPDEGTRICGNAGHWVDLFISTIWGRYNSLKYFSLNIISSNSNDLDDNMLISIITDAGDLFNLTISSRSEPFEGIDETINIQAGSLNVKIDDFRSAKINNEHFVTHLKNWVKDVGHEKSIEQPFSKENTRNYMEYFVSTYLTVSLADMILNKQTAKKITILEIMDFFNETSTSRSR
ncbi:MAG: Gfo/Idh/MocA family oxidoreductase [Emcibacter sp.]|nr:Gfo/Idh/MocA family oxidoreductase [Emcibacter sp.]